MMYGIAATENVWKYDNKRVFDTKENQMCKYLEFLFSIVIEYNTDPSIFKLVYLQISKRVISEGWSSLLTFLMSIDAM